jgi:hypothetical protein
LGPRGNGSNPPGPKRGLSDAGSGGFRPSIGGMQTLFLSIVELSKFYSHFTILQALLFYNKVAMPYPHAFTFQW